MKSQKRQFLYLENKDTPQSEENSKNTDLIETGEIKDDVRNWMKDRIEKEVEFQLDIKAMEEGALKGLGTKVIHRETEDGVTLYFSDDKK